MNAAAKSSRESAKKSGHPFRRAVLRGLAVVLPPLLTIVIFLWVGKTINEYVLIPIESVARHVLTLTPLAEIHDKVPDGANSTGPQTFELDGIEFTSVAGQWIPTHVIAQVQADPGAEVPATAEAYYDRFWDLTYLRREFVVPLFVSCFILLLYFLGSFLAAGMGRILYHQFERLITQLPIIRTVYGSVKQVTDFIFSEQEIAYTRVVAVEYPRKGIWSLGFVTGESMLDLRTAANEPVLSILMPTSPMPATGFTITVRKSETIDLNLTADQAFQFIVSCGVVVPIGQRQESDGTLLGAAIVKQLEAAESDNGSTRQVDAPRSTEQQNST